MYAIQIGTLRSLKHCRINDIGNFKVNLSDDDSILLLGILPSVVYQILSIRVRPRSKTHEICYNTYVIRFVFVSNIETIHLSKYQKSYQGLLLETTFLCSVHIIKAITQVMTYCHNTQCNLLFCMNELYGLKPSFVYTDKKFVHYDCIS